jgi:hypothetical protein
MSEQDTKELLKEAFKEGAKEWLNEKMTELGWWTLKGISAATIFALFYFILTIQGWRK